MGVTFLLVKSEKSRAIFKLEVKNRADAVGDYYYTIGRLVPLSF